MLLKCDGERIYGLGDMLYQNASIAWPLIIKTPSNYLSTILKFEVYPGLARHIGKKTRVVL